jgi:hypothetical protein
MFRKLYLLPSSGKKEGQKPQLLGPLVKLASDLDFLPEDGRRSSFRNVVIFIEI